MSRHAHDDRLSAIIRPIASAVWEGHFQFHRLEAGLKSLADDYGGLELEPDFQRGHVWSEAQQTHFIENALRGVIPSSGLLLQFNCPSWMHNNSDGELPDGFQCLDGLQRATAIMKFMRGEIKPFGLHADELRLTRFDPAGMSVVVGVHCYTKKNDLLGHYLAINTGGTPHASEEIERVKRMMV